MQITQDMKDIIDFWNALGYSKHKYDAKGVNKLLSPALQDHGFKKIREAIKNFSMIAQDKPSILPFSTGWSNSYKLYDMLKYVEGFFYGGHIFDNYQWQVRTPVTKKESSTILEPILNAIKKYGINKTPDELYQEFIESCNTMEYESYLQSQHWIWFRQLAYRWFHQKCCVCDSTDNLNLHHKNYQSLGRETYDDVILVCTNCHKHIHNKGE